jgi:selenide,water dikinase
VVVAAGVDEVIVDLLYDPQTSGGLLVAAAPADGDRLLAELVDAGVPAVQVGRAVSGSKVRVALR